MKKIDLKKNYVIIIVAVLIVGLILARTFGNIQKILFGKKC